MLTVVPGLTLPISLGDIVNSVAQTLGSLWPLLAFAVGVAVAFGVGSSIVHIGKKAGSKR